MKRKKQKVRWVLLLSVVPKRVDVISKCVVGGNLGYVESRMCGGKKISNGNDIVTHGALTFCYLKG